MKKRWPGIAVAFLILLATAAVGWWRMHDEVGRMASTTPARVSSVTIAAAVTVHDIEPEASAELAMAPTAAQGPHARPVTQPKPLPTGSWEEIAPKLKAMAAAGDGLAAWRLARIYHRCDGWGTINAETLKHRYEEERSLSLKVQPDVEVLSFDQWMQRVHAYRDPLASLCGQLGGFSLDAARTNYLRYLQIAARAGVPKAMVQFASLVVDNYPLLDDPDEALQIAPLVRLGDIVRYREQAIGYLEGAIALGEPSALLELGRQYNHGSLFKRDRVRAYAYLSAYLATGAERAALNLPTARALMPVLWDRMSAGERSRAMALARQIEAAFHVRLYLAQGW